jgi:hypothetical protein
MTTEAVADLARITERRYAQDPALAAKYRGAVAHLADIAEARCVRSPMLLAATDAMRRGAVLPPAQLVAPAFLEQACPDFLTPFAVAATQWVVAALTMEAARDRSGQLWRAKTAGAWIDSERTAAMVEACTASSAARLGQAGGG